MSSNPNRIALTERREVSTCFIIFGLLVHQFIGIRYHPAGIVSKTQNHVVYRGVPRIMLSKPQ